MATARTFETRIDLPADRVAHLYKPVRLQALLRAVERHSPLRRFSLEFNGPI